ncbi:MAG: TIGR03757 family integrating conjugative element protein [Gammaproteobacteria bacterium]
MLSIEVFTTSERKAVGAADERLQLAHVRIFTIDQLARFESELSESLPTEAEAAKAEALRRLQGADDADLAPAKNAALGLAKAVQYAIDRYPAVVFDERAVVYGVTDLADAVGHYDAWRRESER